ncbi:MAG: AmmeMemoRadiSam system protein B [Patescibacteria group bacterium]
MKAKKKKIAGAYGALIIVLVLAFSLFFYFKPMWFNKKPQLIRPMAFNDQFYPGDKTELSREINNYLAQAPLAQIKGVKVLMVPHAGYDYSASVMAAAYKTIIGQKIKRIYLIANSHKNYFSGVALDDSEAWETPLGLIKIDQTKVVALTKASSNIQINRAYQQNDHVIEVQLPFLQTVLGKDFKIIPILFGNTADNAYSELADILIKNLEPGDLIVVSSDMSHYPSAQIANKVDAETLKLIKEKDLTGLISYSQTALTTEPGEETILCGLEAVKTALTLATKLNLTPKILMYKNSGDTLFGDKNKVVGYGAVAFTDNQSGALANGETLNQTEQEILKDIARETIEKYVEDRIIPEFKIKDERLNKIQGAFVTLKKKGELRGCIGETIAAAPLWQVVRDMAIAAATDDNRFNPVAPEELKDLTYEVSVLSVPQAINDWRQIRLGQDGVIVKKGFKSGVFLPQVATETNWTLEEFLSQLCVQKAGLAADCYKNDSAVEISIFQTQVF